MMPGWSRQRVHGRRAKRRDENRSGPRTGGERNRLAEALPGHGLRLVGGGRLHAGHEEHHPCPLAGRLPGDHVHRTVQRPVGEVGDRRRPADEHRPRGRRDRRAEAAAGARPDDRRQRAGVVDSGLRDEHIGELERDRREAAGVRRHVGGDVGQQRWAAAGAGIVPGAGRVVQPLRESRERCKLSAVNERCKLSAKQAATQRCKPREPND